MVWGVDRLQPPIYIKGTSSTKRQRNPPPPPIMNNFRNKGFHLSVEYVKNENHQATRYARDFGDLVFILKMIDNAHSDIAAINLHRGGEITFSVDLPSWTDIGRIHQAAFMDADYGDMVDVFRSIHSDPYRR